MKHKHKFYPVDTNQMDGGWNNTIVGVYWACECGVIKYVKRKTEGGEMK